MVRVYALRFLCSIHEWQLLVNQCSPPIFLPSLVMELLSSNFSNLLRSILQINNFWYSGTVLRLTFLIVRVSSNKMEQWWPSNSFNCTSKFENSPNNKRFVPSSTNIFTLSAIVLISLFNTASWVVIFLFTPTMVSASALLVSLESARGVNRGKLLRVGLKMFCSFLLPEIILKSTLAFGYLLNTFLNL